MKKRDLELNFIRIIVSIKSYPNMGRKKFEVNIFRKKHRKEYRRKMTEKNLLQKVVDSFFRHLYIAPVTFKLSIAAQFYKKLQ